MNLPNPLVSSYVVEVPLPLKYCSYFAESLEDIADLGVGYFGARFSQDDDVEGWVVKANFLQKPDLEELKNRLQILADSVGIECPILQVYFLENMDWLEEVVKNSPPVVSDGFYIYSDYNPAPTDSTKIAIQINPGMAFGTGHHQTTFLCLNALSRLKQNGFAPANVLDMGCGSGILAIACKKLWPNGKVLAVDIEELSIIATKENATKNNIELLAMAGDGFNLSQVNANKPYDLILANILPKPLQQMAASLIACLGQGGYAVLSGYTDKYKDEVLDKYKALNIIENIEKERWQATTLKS